MAFLSDPSTHENDPMLHHPRIDNVRTKLYGHLALLCVVCFVFTACSGDEESSPVDPSGDGPVIERDTALTWTRQHEATLLTPVLYCHPNESAAIMMDVRDTFTIRSSRLTQLPRFVVWLVSLNDALPDTLHLFDNNHQSTSFWFDDHKISTMRWIPQGRYRVLIVDAGSHAVLRSVAPDLEVRSLLITGVNKTEASLSDSFHVYLKMPYYRGDARARNLTAWMGTTQLPIRYSNGSPYEYGLDHAVTVVASSPGSGVLVLREGRSGQESTGPHITVHDVAFSKYFRSADLTWSRRLDWKFEYRLRCGETVLQAKDSSFLTQDTLTKRIERGCCDTLTRGDTTKLTSAENNNDRWQAIIVVDTSALTCRFIRLFWHHSESYRDRTEVSGYYDEEVLSLVNVPVQVMPSGAWQIDLDERTISDHLAGSTFLRSYTWRGIDCFARSQTSVGELNVSVPMRLRLLLNAN